MWDPEDVGSVFVDEHGEPTIGLANDFKLRTSAAPTESYTKQLIALRWIADRFAEFEIVQSEEEITRYLTRQDTRISELVANAGVTSRMTHIALLKSDIDSKFGRGPAIAQLDKAFSAAPYCNCPLSRVPAADMLFMLLPKYHFKTRANYFASGCQTGTDLMLISSLVDDGTTLKYRRLELNINNSYREETRAMLGIAVPVFGDERDKNMMGYVPSLSTPVNLT